MKSIEEQLKMKKVHIDNIEIPEELEDRLRVALASIEKKSESVIKRTPWLMRHKGIAAVLAVLLFFSIYNYDVLAYYGKKIMGYDEITNGSLKDLNELGMGQEINKSYKFKNGTEVFLDGVMMDDNKLVLMYRVKGDNAEKVDGLRWPKLRGTISKCQNSGGSGLFNDEHTEIKRLEEFEPPFILDRTLTFSITSEAVDESRGETAKIKFRLDRDKAIKRTIKSNVNKSIEFQGIKYNFTTLSATPLSVILEGNIEVQTEADRKLFSLEFGDSNSMRRELRVELWETYIKNGKEVTEKIQEEGGGGGSNGSEITSRYDFTGLKANLKKLTLKLVKLEDMRIIDKSINVNSETKDKKVIPETEELIIKEIKEQNGDTIVVFNGEKDIAFGTALFLGEAQAEMLVENSEIVNIEGKDILQKTYRFKGHSRDMKLMFKTISYETYINKEVTLYEEK